MPTPQASTDHYRQQRALTVTALVAIRAAWQAMTPDFDLSWLSAGPRVRRVIVAAQRVSVQNAAAYVPRVLDELGIDAPASGSVIPEQLIGVAADGRPLDSLLETGVIRAKQAVDGGLDAREALTRGRAWLEFMAQTEIADAGRVASGMEVAVRPDVGGYVRMLNPPSCSRCVILAGRFYRWNTGFERHPRCDCIHIPVTGRQAARDEGLIDDPQEYFDSLDQKEQDRAFTKAGAQAIRDGADLNQVVNARRGAAGLSPAGGRLTAAEQRVARGDRPARGHLERTDVFGQQLFTTTEGTTRRGGFGGSRKGQKRIPRLMPESIYELAQDRDDAIRLLKRYGYIT